MFNKILVTLDGSAAAEGVFPYLRDLAPKFNSEVHVFGVCIEPERGLARLFEAYLEKIASDFQGQKIKAKAVLFHGGSPADRILEYAEKNKIDLITMTTYGRGGISRWLLGSTTEKVIQGAVTPVLLVQGRRPGEPEVLEKAVFSRILVPLDGSEVGEAALPCVEALAAQIKSSVMLLHVNPPLYKALGEVEYPAPFPQEMIESLRAAGRAYLGGVSQRLEKKGFEVNFELVSGDPAEKILEYAKEKRFNLIAMSSHGRGGIARWVLGSVANKVIRGGEVPVWIVKAPGVISARP